ncbi:MAG: AEC family transporter [Clostridia bacterium]|nr:AEC family transporter [Clostridia bacterium]
MIDISILFAKVSLLLLMIVPGFLLAKARLAPDGLGKGLSNLILYAAQPALIIKGYIREFDMEVFKRALLVLLFSLITHLIFTAIAFLTYRRGRPENQLRVLRYATVFTNAGYMGIPLICAIFNAEYAIYASIYVMVFNIFCWSLGCFIYTKDRRYMSPRKMFLNPASISTYVGLILFLTPLNRLLAPLPATYGFIDVLKSVPYDLIDGLQALVAPLAMILIGLRLAELDWKRAFKDLHLYIYLFVRMILSPAIVWAVTKLLMLIPVFDDPVVMTVILLSAATPAATATSMFAEKFDGDSVYAGKLVSVSTLISLGTMPLVALLLWI